ncbi:ground-like domain protein [Dictyocaulus viviparus]|uniref:Ground-like domain protein n=1 Tax=Dictyocaulus viviparus TaxID=29172 RepID=A0A0D8YFZ1_DICVI|nr:ground-like domain protein [Dictyocaulus viviparus]
MSTFMSSTFMYSWYVLVIRTHSNESFSACPPPATGCNSGKPSYQLSPPVPSPSYAAPPPLFGQSSPFQPPIYQSSQQQFPQQGPSYSAQPGGGLEQLPAPNYGQAPPQAHQLQGPSYQDASPPVGGQPVVEQQQADYKYQPGPAASAAAGQKNEEVIEEEEEGVTENSIKGSTNAPNETSTSDGEERLVDVANLKLTDDPLCNSEELRKLMLDNIEENINNSKRLIQLAAEAQFGGRFDVICANGDFSYVTNTELFCQETKGDISCYTYRQL